MSLAAGRLDRRIVIERLALVDDGYQKRPGSWAALATRPAQYVPGRGSERFAAAAENATQPAAFRIRWSPAVADVSPADRVRALGRIWTIAGVAELGRREGLELMCVASDDGAAGG